MKNVGRNGKVELWRFIFSIAVMCYHIYKYILRQPAGSLFFSRGYIGVEFFFVLSGILMAKSAYGEIQRNENIPLGKSTTRFIKRKISGLMPMHIVVFVMLFTVFCFAKEWSLAGIFENLLESIPGFFFIRMAGIYGPYVNFPEWYISVMLIAMLMLYPLTRKWYTSFTHIIAPLTALLILGYLSHKYGGLGSIRVWTPIGSKPLLRGISEISLGAVCFEVSRTLKERKMTKRQRTAITVLETASLAGAVWMSLDVNPKEYDIYALIFLAVALTCAFSQQSYGEKLFSNDVCMYLGKLSLPIYLVHRTAWVLVQWLGEPLSDVWRAAAAIGLAIILSIGLLALNEAYFKRKRARTAA